MKHIPREFIDDLLSRVNIVDVIGQSVTLKKKGQNYFGCCPFHNEKTASFSVNEKKQMFHCFGCGVSGSVISFLMDNNRLTFPEAIELLAEQQGLPIPYTKTSKNTPFSPSTSLRRPLFELMARITQFYQQQLTLPNAQIARDYLQHRGLSDQIIAHYKLGYSPNDWQTTRLQVVKDEAESRLYLTAGMQVVNDNKKSYDRFRGRIMFPIRDRQGHVIGFGGRALQADDQVKYLNSPDSDLFHKGQQLYGLFEALELHKNPAQLVVVEGYMDVIALAQYGITYAVAALGTATTPDHFRLLFRATDVVTFCYDGDGAGQRAAWKALLVALPLLQDGKTIQFVFLPESEDPDSCIRKEGQAAFEQRLQNSMPLSQFLFRTLLQTIDLGTAEGKSKFIASAVPLLKQINAPYYQLSFKQEFAHYLKLTELSEIDQLMQTQSNPIKTQPKMAQIASTSSMLTTSNLLLATVLQYPSLVSKKAVAIDFKSQMTLSEQDPLALYQMLVDYCMAHSPQNTAQILTQFEEAPYFGLLQAMAFLELHQEEQHIERFYEGLLLKSMDDLLKTRRDHLIAKQHQSPLTAEEKQEIAQIILALSENNTMLRS